MGRGGSDLTATVIGSAAQVDEIQVSYLHPLSFGYLKCSSTFFLLFVDCVFIQCYEYLAKVCFNRRPRHLNVICGAAFFEAVNYQTEESHNHI